MATFMSIIAYKIETYRTIFDVESVLSDPRSRYLNGAAIQCQDHSYLLESIEGDKYSA